MSRSLRAADGSPATTTALARRNPTVKFALLFLVSLALVFVFDPVTPAALYAIALVAVLIGARIPIRTLLIAQLPFLGFALGLIVVNALSRPGDVLFSGLGMRVTVEGLIVGSGLAMRTMLIGVLSIAFIASTDGITLMTSLRQHARLGERVSYAILAGYRLLQELPSEWQTIRHAHAVRAPLSSRTGRPVFGIRSFGRTAFSLLVMSLRRSERMAQALESRGLGLRPRTTWQPVPLTWVDGAFAAVVIAVVVMVISASAALGVLRGIGVLAGG